MRFLCYCIQNNQGWGRGYKPKLKAEADTCNPYQDLDYSGYHKTESNNYFIYTLYMYIEQNKNGSHVFASSLTASQALISVNHKRDREFNVY